MTGRHPNPDNIQVAPHEIEVVISEKSLVFAVELKFLDGDDAVGDLTRVFEMVPEATFVLVENVESEFGCVGAIQTVSMNRSFVPSNGVVIMI